MALHIERVDGMFGFENDGDCAARVLSNALDVAGRVESARTENGRVTAFLAAATDIQS